MTQRRTYPTVVLYSFFPWEHEYPSTAHGLAKALTEHTDVVFVSKPPTLKDTLLGGAKHLNSSEATVLSIADDPGLTVVELPASLPINALPRGAFYEFWRKLNDRRMSAALAPALKQLGVEEYIWINLYAPTQFIDLDLHRAPLKRLYYSVDAIDQASYTAKHGPAAEIQQLARADMGLATSTKLLRGLHEAHGTLDQGDVEMLLLPNAMDADLYRAGVQHEEPAALQGIPHPRAMYVGNLDGERLDFAGLSAFAKSSPDLQLVLVGPWNASESQRAELQALANVHLVGRVTQDKCPALLAHADLGLIPFRKTALTAAIYPLKINEYLAMGLPVLSTAFSSDILGFSDIITLASVDTWSEHAPQLLQANAVEDKEGRIARASSSTWSGRAQSLLQALDVSQAGATLEAITPTAC